MEVSEWNVYDMEESIIASGLPMSAFYDEKEFNWQTENLNYWKGYDIPKIIEILGRKDTVQNWIYNRPQKGRCIVCGEPSKRALRRLDGLELCSVHLRQMDRYGYIKNLTVTSPNRIYLDDSGEFAWMILRDKDSKEVARAKISCEDIVKLSDIKFKYSSKIGYAVSSSHGLLHKIVCDAKIVDHINRDKLDCRRENLRSASDAQNNHNRSKGKNGNNRVMGVSYSGTKKRWRAYITVGYKTISLGYFDDEKNAIISRLNAEVKYFKDFAPQNEMAKKYGIENPYIKEGCGRKYNLLHAIKHFQRIKRLSDTANGSGHQTALSGILVSANVSATVKFWAQFERYHFAQIVSSMSTMHRLRQMAMTQSAQFNEKTSPEIIKAFCDLVRSGVDDETIAYSCPMGLELTARITTNYLQLKTMYAQRHNHKLKEWRDFCDWIEGLPHSELITQNKEEKEND